jgi:hypothetical protein
LHHKARIAKTMNAERRIAEPITNALRAAAKVVKQHFAWPICRIAQQPRTPEERSAIRGLSWYCPGYAPLISLTRYFPAFGNALQLLATFPPAKRASIQACAAAAPWTMEPLWSVPANGV